LRASPTNLFWGRNEDNGLRCVYHGWKYDVNGQCVDMPSEPEDSNFKDKIVIKAYPTQEFGDVIWAYMGPADLKPEVPQLEWARVPSTHRRASRFYQGCNYMQALEGEIDTAHASYLHSVFKDGKVVFAQNTDWTPQLTIKETDYGFLYGARRRDEDEGYYWRVTQWLLPTHALIPGDGWPKITHFYIPIDDEHVTAWEVTYNPNEPLTPTQWADAREKMELEREVRKLPNGSTIDTWRSARNIDNDYLIDREMQRTVNYTGIQGVRRQDMAVIESMGGVVERNLERLGTTDRAIIMARKRLLHMARQLREGVEPKAAFDGELYRVRQMAIKRVAEDTFEGFLDTHGAEGLAKV
jgi:phenylpropionate dioxygenase-like ring-hydroxylating dioxygenase large terminal subunit